MRDAFVAADLQDAFALYVRRTLGPALDRVGMQPQPGEPEGTGLLRPKLLGWLGRSGDDAAVRAWAREAVQAMLADPAALDPSLQGVALTVAAHDGDEALFEQYRQRFESATIPRQRQQYLAGLAAFRDPEIVDRALEYTLSGPLRTQEILRIPFSLLETPAGRERAYRWMTDNYGTLAQRIPAEFTSFFPYFAGGCEPERLEAAAKFFGDPQRDTPATRVSLAKVTDAVGDCARLREREAASVAAFLTQYVGSR
jgi:hypothetical protein